jgi:hypothetical protein
MSTKKKLTDKQWRELKPACQAAAKGVEDSLRAWAKIASDTVNGDEHASWRWLLGDLRERCYDGGIECPYSITYLTQLAETHTAAKGDLERGVPVSVLIEGRKLENLLDLATPGTTVGRMKAHVFKESNKDSRSVQEIEAEQKRHRLDGRTRKERDKENQKILDVSTDPKEVESLLKEITSHIAVYKDALLGLEAEEEVAFPKRETIRALDASEALVRVLKGIRE